MTSRFAPNRRVAVEYIFGLGRPLIKIKVGFAELRFFSRWEFDAVADSLPPARRYIYQTYERSAKQNDECEKLYSSGGHHLGIRRLLCCMADVRRHWDPNKK